MRIRPYLALSMGLLIAACGGEAAEQTADAAEAAVMTDDEALDAFIDGWTQHYNLHHASMVADYYADDAVWLGADGSVQEGRAEIEAGLEAAMAASPTANVMSRDRMVFGDWAIDLGTYAIDMTPEGADMMSLNGNYLTALTRVDGDWKLMYGISNYDADPPEGTPRGEPPADTPADEGAMSELVGDYQTHFNLGHASMVADLYTENASASFANTPFADGRAAIEAVLEERMGASPQITIHDVGTEDLGDGWALDGGWYELTASTDEGDIVQTGNYMILCQQDAEGNWKIHWAVTNGHTDPA